MNIKIDHTALYVRDLDGARDFFIRYFNAEPSEQYHNPKTDFKSYFLSFGNSDNVDELTSILKDGGYEVVSGPRVTGDGYYESQIIGVEGNVIEITE